MPPSTWNAAKAKVQLRLSVQRLRIAQQKKEAHAKGSRRDIALLLEKGKTESARVKVEAVINEDVNLELYELLELYCELLIARFGLLDQNSTRDPDPGISEGVCSIIHAAPRTEVKELLVLRDMLMHKYGRDFSAAAMENRSGCVSERIMRKLVIETPSGELVDAYLGEIAKAYSVKWASASSITAAAQGSIVDGLSGSDTLESLPLYSREISDKLPDIPPTEDETGKHKASAGGKSHQTEHSKEETEDEFAVLARRFEELKKR